MGLTKFGLTNVYLVTGGSEKSQYTNPQGQLYRGVCAAEYQERVLPNLVSDGNALFARGGRYEHSWILQQDGARVHTAVTSLAAANAAPGGVLHPWPANSPDLNLIEHSRVYC